MKMTLVGILLLSLLCTSALAQDDGGDLHDMVTYHITESKTENFEGEYIDDMEIIIEPGEDIDLFTLKFTVKKDVPLEYGAVLNVSYNAECAFMAPFNLCAVMESPYYVDYVLPHANPEGSFPRLCPIPTGKYELNQMQLHFEGTPQVYENPEGEGVVDIDFGIPDQPIDAHMHMKAKISRKLPKVPKVPSFG